MQKLLCPSAGYSPAVMKAMSVAFTILFLSWPCLDNIHGLEFNFIDVFSHGQSALDFLDFRWDSCLGWHFCLVLLDSLGSLLETAMSPPSPTHPHHLQLRLQVC